MGIYTNTSAFRRALLTSDIYSENLREQMRAAEIQKQLQEEAEDRQSNSYLGKLAGGALGFFIGGPAGAKMGANIGSTAGMNFDNTDYTSYIGNNPAEFMGKFNAAEGLQAYETLKDYAENMEDQQDSMNKMAGLKLAFDAFTMNFGDSLNMDKQAMVPDPNNPGEFIKAVDSAGNPLFQDNWYEMNLKEKMKHFKNYKTDFKMSDFLGSMKKLTSPEGLIESVAGSGIVEDSGIDQTNLFEKGFNNLMENKLKEDINNILGSVDSNVGIGNASVDDLNNSLIGMGYQPLSPDLFNIIDTEDIIDSNTFPEDFNWGIFK